MSGPSAFLLRTQSDERLVALTRAGHERAFEAIVRRYRRGLLGACQRICADGRGEDVLQQALLAAWAGLRRGDDVRDLRAWLYRIVRNEAVSHRRRAGRDGLALLDTLSLAESPQEEAERRAVVQETLEAIAGLPDRQRAALLSIAVQGRSQDEVAGELGLSAVAVRALVHRARSALRAAATAVVPLPVVAWAAGTGEAGPSVAGLVAGAGGTGVSATLLKAGAVAGVAATAVSAPLIVAHRPRAPVLPRSAPAQVSAPPAIRVARRPPPPARRVEAPVGRARVGSAGCPAGACSRTPVRTATPPAPAHRRHRVAVPVRTSVPEREDDHRGSRRGGVPSDDGGSRHRQSGDDDGSRGSGDPGDDQAIVAAAGGDDSHEDGDSHDGGDLQPTATPTLAATAVPTPSPTATDDHDDGGGD